jgi:hypothetical protein
LEKAYPRALSRDHAVPSSKSLNFRFGDKAREKKYSKLEAFSRLFA